MEVSERIGKRIEAIQAFIAAVKAPHKIISMFRLVQTEGGMRVPRYYALGYFDPCMDAEHWYLFPFHYVVRAAREIDHRWNHYRHQLSSIDVAVIDAYHAGIKEGEQRELTRISNQIVKGAIKNMHARELIIQAMKQ
jgi:hypothetical protein